MATCPKRDSPCVFVACPCPGPAPAVLSAVVLSFAVLRLPRPASSYPPELLSTDARTHSVYRVGFSAGPFRRSSSARSLFRSPCASGRWAAGCPRGVDRRSGPPRRRRRQQRSSSVSHCPCTSPSSIPSAAGAPCATRPTTSSSTPPVSHWLSASCSRPWRGRCPERVSPVPPRRFGVVLACGRRRCPRSRPWLPCVHRRLRQFDLATEYPFSR